MKTVTVSTFGCKVNQFESEALLDTLERQGYRVLPPGEKADLTIINTCTVTHRADFQSRQCVRRALRANPETRLVVTGCSVQVDPGVYSGMEGVALLVGNDRKHRIPHLLSLLDQGPVPRIQVGDIRREVRFKGTPPCSFPHHTRAFLKIQDGCNSLCSYCIVPSARGPSRSLSPKEVFHHVRAFREKGFREVVLTGIHLGAYGVDLDPPVSLERLLRDLEELETPDRLRVTSIEPGDFSGGLIDLLSRSRKVCPHLHIPIQSGSDTILRKMNRDYPRSFLTELILELHEKIPDLALGADFIVGFPGETESLFQETLEWVQSLPFAYLHVFPFSPRRGTPAARLFPGVEEAKKKERSERLRSLGREKRRSYYRRFVGRRLRVLIERRDHKDRGWRGLTRNYLPVWIEDKDGSEDMDWKNREMEVEATGSTDQGVLGRPVVSGGSRSKAQDLLAEA